MQAHRSQTLDAIVTRAQRGDPEAFDALVDRYSVRLYGLVYRLTGRRDDAEDLVQEVYVRLVRTIPKYVHEGRFEAWLFRIATNLVRDWARKRSRTPRAASLDDGPWTEADGPGAGTPRADLSAAPPEYRMELADDADELQRALTRLNAAEREVIMLRHFAGMSFDEIADAMGTPLGTALARAHRGLAKLRRLMESDHA